LEGTGSLVLDRINKIAYCCLSARTHEKVIDVWAQITGYQTCIFHAYDENHRAIYHTNVMMNIGDTFVIICLSAIKNKTEKQKVVNYLSNKSKKIIIPITIEQLNNFVGNSLQIKNIYGVSVMCLSETAYKSLSDDQKKVLMKACPGGFAIVDYSVIEKARGGSVRCSLLEFYPTRVN